MIVPAACAAWLLLFRGATENLSARWVGLFGAIATLLVSLIVANQFCQATSSA